MPTSASTVLSIRRMLAILCVLAILAQALVVAIGAHYDHNDEPSIDATYRLTLDLSHTLGDTSRDCQNSSHCHGHIPVLGLGSLIPSVLLNSQNDFFADHSNVLPQHIPASPFRPPIV